MYVYMSAFIIKAEDWGKKGSIIKDNEILWKCSKLKKATETSQLTAVSDPRMDLVLQGEEKCYRRHYFIS